MSDILHFAIDNIKPEQFAILEHHFSTEKKVELEVGFDFQVDPISKTITSTVKIHFLADKEIFILMHFSIRFKIQKESWQYLQTDDGMYLRVEHARHLAMVVLGSTRGYLFAKLEGTSLSNFILPTLNIHQIIKEGLHLKQK